MVKLDIKLCWGSSTTESEQASSGWCTGGCGSLWHNKTFIEEEEDAGLKVFSLQWKVLYFLHCE